MQKTAYELRISDWSSDVFSSDLGRKMALFASTEIAQFKRSMREALDSLVTKGEEFTVDDLWKKLTLRGIEGRAPDPAIVGATQIGRASCRARVWQYV